MDFGLGISYDPVSVLATFSEIAVYVILKQFYSSIFGLLLEVKLEDTSLQPFKHWTLDEPNGDIV